MRPQRLKLTQPSSCQMIVTESRLKRCKSCREFRPLLRASYWKKRHAVSKAARSKFTSNSKLRTPNRTKKMNLLATQRKAHMKKIRMLKQRIQLSTDRCGVRVQAELHDEVMSAIRENDETIKAECGPGTFRRLFWEQQKKAAAACKSPNGMRWHPYMIKWALQLKMLSSSCYHTLRTAGFITMPSERTLRDYTHFFKNKPGFFRELNDMLVKEAEKDGLTARGNHVIIVFDEMKVKEDLVYSKYDSDVVGFVDLGGFDSDLRELERRSLGKEVFTDVATHMLVFMVRGLTSQLRFPYAHFPSDCVTADALMSIVWERVMCTLAGGVIPRQPCWI